MDGMFKDARNELTSLGVSTRIEDETTPFLLRRIWLPRLIYLAIPYFYMTAGLLALATTIYISQWYWVLPHYLLFSAVCLHMGFVIRRWRLPAGRKSG